MTNIERFYLTNHDFNIIVNKGIQAYGKSKDEMLSNVIVREIYSEMQEGGINYHEKSNSREQDP
jgi:hypothetical protein